MAASGSSIVFGASGVVGQAIVRLLSESSAGRGDATATVTAVSRSGYIPSLSGLPGVCCKAGDALDEHKTVELCQGASAIFCSIGLAYNSAVWEKNFPVIVQSMLKATESTGAILVWIDNLYMFGPEAARSGQPIQENSRSFTSFGRKPSLRGQMDQTMLDAADSGRCKVAIVRASDFYGPGVTNSAMGETVFPAVIKGRRVYLVGDPETKHAFTYVPDLAKAAVLIAQAGESAWGRAWHCPNAPAVTQSEMVRKAASLGGQENPPKITVIKGILRAVMGLFITPLRDMAEMAFVWDSDYLVDHSEFSQKFPDSNLPTPLEVGLRETVDFWRSK